jgi:DNA invertase Pin-like site-specific DNA recombinase/vacuolar-type H+-ATPase subunit F/Vma7
MSYDKIKEIADEKKGEILEYQNDMFQEIKLKCYQGHIFHLYANDIILNDWCPHCLVDKKEPLEEVFISLNLAFEKHYPLQNQVYDYGIMGKRKFLVQKGEDDNKIRLAQKQNFNLIIVIDDLIPDLKEQVWNALKENKLISYVGKKQIIVKHQCEIIKKLDNEKDEVGSIIKSAPEPYPEMVKYSVGYIRVSTAMQVQDGFSLEAQESKISAESEKHNLFLKRLYIDKGISGGSMEKRLALEEMRKELAENTWIIVNSVSRLARNTKDLLSLVDEIEKKKCHLIIIDLNMDITSPSGKLILTLMASQAQFERELTSERVKGVLQHLKSTGSLRTKPRFGWKLNPDRSPDAPIHIRNEEEQHIIRRIKNLRSRNKMIGIVAFTKKVEESGVPHPRNSKKWYHTTLKTILENEGIK